MRFKITGSQIIAIVVAVVLSVLVAHYEDFLPYRWQTYAAPDGSFSIELPGAPEVKTSQVPIGGGGSATLHFINAVPGGSRAYTCTYVEVENSSLKSPSQILESARDGSLRKVQGTVLTQNQITVQGFPGLQFQARARGDSLMDSRLVLVGSRLYMIMAVAADGHSREPKAVQRLFDSFKLNSKPSSNP